MRFMSNVQFDCAPENSMGQFDYEHVLNVCQMGSLKNVKQKTKYNDRNTKTHFNVQLNCKCCCCCCLFVIGIAKIIVN